MSATPNSQVLDREKALITTDALAAQGKLNPAQQDMFIDYVIEETMLANNARVVRFRNEDLDIDKIGVGERVAMLAKEAVAPQNRRGVTTSKITLTPVEIMVPFEISDTFKEINLEGEGVEEHIIRMMAKRFANNKEQMYIESDVLGLADYQDNIFPPGSTTEVIRDNFLGAYEGWLRLGDAGNTVDLGGAAIGASTFARLKRALPTKFRRDPASLRFFVASDLAQLYSEKLSTRVGPTGEAALTGAAPPPGFGIPIVPVPLMPFYPRVVEHLLMPGAATPVSLRYAPVQSGTEIVTLSTLGDAPVPPYVGGGTDYTMDYVNGTITPAASLQGQTIKITYEANPQILLTHMNNFIIGIGRDIRIERDRDIYKRMDQFAITAKVSCQVEESSALVKGYNSGDTI